MEEREAVTVAEVIVEEVQVEAVTVEAKLAQAKGGGLVVAAKAAVVRADEKEAAMVEVEMVEEKAEVATVVATEEHPSSHLRSIGREAERCRLRSSSCGCSPPKQ